MSTPAHFGKMADKLRAADKRKINSKLVDLCKIYHKEIPTTELKAIFEPFDLAMEDGIYCGREGFSNENLGRGIHLALTWYKMPSGRFEIVAYVS